MEAERAAAYATSAEGIAAALIADPTERARAKAMARAATGPSIIEDRSSAPFGDSTDPLNHLSDREESEKGGGGRRGIRFNEVGKDGRGVCGTKRR